MARDKDTGEGFMDAEFAKFREERLKSRPRAQTATDAAPTGATTPEEHLDGADDDFARFRAARLRDGGPRSGRMKKPQVDTTPGGSPSGPMKRPIDPTPASGSMKKPQVEAAVDGGRPSGRMQKPQLEGPVEASAPARAMVVEPATFVEPHAKTSIVAVDAPPPPAAAPAAPAPVEEPKGMPDFDQFRAQRALNRQVQEPTTPSKGNGQDDGMFFGTSTQERRSVTARVRESRSDLRTADIAAALATLELGSSPVAPVDAPKAERTPGGGTKVVEATPDVEKTPPGGKRRAPPPPLPTRESA